MDRSHGPISPLSMNSSDSFASRYGSLSGPVGGTPSDVPYAGGPYGSARPKPISPPGSQHPSSGTDMSRPSASSGSMRPPSSASSVGGRSDGRMGFGGPASRDSGKSTFKPESEDALQRHYHTLKGYLASSLRDEKGNLKPNRARDKLLRLSVTQFMELSTDVYDELCRREDDRLQRVKEVPRFLLPKPMFHPKRNQARQKLSTLPIERFRQLATDVFYELERRIPRFAGGDIERPPSGSSSAGGPRAPSRGGQRGPPPPGWRPPPPGGPGRPPMPNGMGPGPGPGPNGMGPPQPPYQSFRPNSPGPMNGAPPRGPMRRPSEQSEGGSLGRPLPKTSQSNTIVPNKSTMIEDDDSDEDETFGLGQSARMSEAPSSTNEKDREIIKSHETEIVSLKEQLESLQGKLQGNEQEFEASSQEHERGISAERSQWQELREELEQKAMDAQRLHDSVRNELEMMKRNKTEDERDLLAEHDRDLEDLRAQLEDTQEEKSDLKAQLQRTHAENDDMRAQLDNLHAQHGDLQRQSENHQAELDELRDHAHGQTGVGSEDQERRIQILEQSLATQEKLTNEVREEATLYLQEMRDLSRQNDYAVEQEEKLAAQVVKLESDIEAWRSRYARLKVQNKTLRASTIGLGLQPSFDAGNLTRQQSLFSQDGLVRDVDITRFQLAVDDLLKSARQSETMPMLESVKQVTLVVSSIASNVGTDGYPTPSPSPHSPSVRLREPSVGKLKARVMGYANSLITATKQHAAAAGLSPVALLDAAASNLTASVIELIKAVGISATDLQESPILHPTATPNDDLDSLYGSPGLAHSSRPSLSLASPPPPLDEPGVKQPAPLNVGRSNTTKKANGWFGWGRSTSVDEGSEKGEAEEYDPYR